MPESIQNPTFQNIVAYKHDWCGPWLLGYTHFHIKSHQTTKYICLFAISATTFKTLVSLHKLLQVTAQEFIFSLLTITSKHPLDSGDFPGIFLEAATQSPNLLGRQGNHKLVQVMSLSLQLVESLNLPVTTVIPEVYHELAEVFSKIFGQPPLQLFTQLHQSIFTHWTAGYRGLLTFIYAHLHPQLGFSLWGKRGGIQLCINYRW